MASEPQTAGRGAGSSMHLSPVIGRFSDGNSASAQDCEVRLALSGIAIRVSGSRDRLWPYESLRVGEPLRANAIDVLISSQTTPGITLFVPGPEFAAALAERAPHLTARAERWRHARPWIISTGAIVAVIAAISMSSWSPLKSLAGFLPESWRDRLGQQAVDSMTSGRQACVAKSGRDALLHLSERLSTAAEPSRAFKIIVVDWSLMNAFAVPGSQIVLTRGLIEKAESADELAGVLAHEMGHGVEMHPETSMIRSIGLAAALDVMMGGSGGALANVGVLLAQLGYTRVAEAEADDQAIRILRGATISPQGLGRFFQRVDDEENADKTDSGFPDFGLLRTHPPSKSRAELIRQQPDYAATPALTAKQWQDLKAICSVKETPKPAASPQPKDDT